MPQYARPTSDYHVGNWARFGSGTSGSVDLWENIDEVSPDDGSSFILNNPDAGLSESVYICNLSSVDDPLIHTGHKLRARVSISQLDTDTNVNVRMRLIAWLGTPSAFGAVSDQIWNLTDIGDWHDLEADINFPENIADYSNMRVEFTLADNGQKFASSVTWIELEVPGSSGYDYDYDQCECSPCGCCKKFLHRRGGL